MGAALDTPGHPGGPLHRILARPFVRPPGGDAPVTARCLQPPVAPSHANPGPPSLQPPVGSDGRRPGAAPGALRCTHSLPQSGGPGSPPHRRPRAHTGHPTHPQTLCRRPPRAPAVATAAPWNFPSCAAGRRGLGSTSCSGGRGASRDSGGGEPGAAAAGGLNPRQAPAPCPGCKPPPGPREEPELRRRHAPPAPAAVRPSVPPPRCPPRAPWPWSVPSKTRTRAHGIAAGGPLVADALRPGEKGARVLGVASAPGAVWCDWAGSLPHFRILFLFSSGPSPDPASPFPLLVCPLPI